MRWTYPLPVTLGSVRVMGVFESGCCQSSANPRSSSGRAAGSVHPLRGGAEGGPAVGQSLFQWPVSPQPGQGLEGGRGLGHWRAQCPSFPHLKQAPGGVAFGGVPRMLSMGDGWPQGGYDGLGLEGHLLVYPSLSAGFCQILTGIIDFKGHFYQFSVGSLGAVLCPLKFFF